MKDTAKMSDRELRMEVVSLRAKLMAYDEMFDICKYMVDSSAADNYRILGIDPTASIRSFWGAEEPVPEEGPKTKRLREIINGWAES